MQRWLYVLLLICAVSSLFLVTACIPKRTYLIDQNIYNNYTNITNSTVIGGNATNISNANLTAWANVSDGNFRFKVDGVTYEVVCSNSGGDIVCDFNTAQLIDISSISAGQAYVDFLFFDDDDIQSVTRDLYLSGGGGEVYLQSNADTVSYVDATGMTTLVNADGDGYFALSDGVTDGGYVLYDNGTYYYRRCLDEATGKSYISWKTDCAPKFSLIAYDSSVPSVEIEGESNTEFYGSRQMFTYANKRTVSGYSTQDGQGHSATFGNVQAHAGSIKSITADMVISGLTLTGTVAFCVYKNGASLTCTNNVNIVGNGNYQASIVLSRNSKVFVANDELTCYYLKNSGTFTNTYNCMVEVQYDT